MTDTRGAQPIALLLFFAARKISNSFWTDDNWGFVELQDDWHALKRVLDELDERNSENSPESSRHPTDNANVDNIALSPMQNGSSRSSTGVNAFPRTVP